MRTPCTTLRGVSWGVRHQHAKTFGRGEQEVLEVENQRVFAFTRQYEGETVLVVANLSRFAQALTLPLQDFAGHYPVELFSQMPFPQIGESDYPLAIGPHGFYWFVLRSEEEAVAVPLSLLRWRNDSSAPSPRSNFPVA